MEILEEIERAIIELKYENMTPVQKKAIPCLLMNKDILVQAQTGTGKTAAYAIPMIQNIIENIRAEQEVGNYSGVKAMVICPTRELVMQVANEIRLFTKYLSGVKILPVYGGQDMGRQIKALKGKTQIVVGTPGRLKDHLRRRTLKVANLKVLVLDEADEMLNLGFRNDIEEICQKLPEKHQTAMFSATMPDGILNIADKYQIDAKVIKVFAKREEISLVTQYYCPVKNEDKIQVLLQLMRIYCLKRILIFCNTKRKVDKVHNIICKSGYVAEKLHGELPQDERNRVMKHFREKKINILVATDVAARGIDVADIEAVINYDLPQNIETYIHRIGRTGRAGHKGRAFTLVESEERNVILKIETSCNIRMINLTKKVKLSQVSEKDRKVKHRKQLQKDSDRQQTYNYKGNKENQKSKNEKMRKKNWKNYKVNKSGKKFKKDFRH